MRKLAILAILAALATPAVAQWQVPDNNIPGGRGTGTGFSAIPPTLPWSVLRGMGEGFLPGFSTDFALDFVFAVQFGSPQNAADWAVLNGPKTLILEANTNVSVTACPSGCQFTSVYAAYNGVSKWVIPNNSTVTINASGHLAEPLETTVTTSTSQIKVRGQVPPTRTQTYLMAAGQQLITGNDQAGRPLLYRPGSRNVSATRNGTTVLIQELASNQIWLMTPAAAGDTVVITHQSYNLSSIASVTGAPGAWTVVANFTGHEDLTKTVSVGDMVLVRDISPGVLEPGAYAARPARGQINLGFFNYGDITITGGVNGEFSPQHSPCTQYFSNGDFLMIQGQVKILANHNFYTYIATGNTNIFSGPDLNGNTLAYEVMANAPWGVSVCVNRDQLLNRELPLTSEFRADDGTSVVTSTTPPAGARVTIIPRTGWTLSGGPVLKDTTALRYWYYIPRSGQGTICSSTNTTSCNATSHNALYIVGTGTTFTKDFNVYDVIVVPNYGMAIIVDVISDTQLQLDRPGFIPTGTTYGMWINGEFHEGAHRVTAVTATSISWMNTNNSEPPNPPINKPPVLGVLGGNVFVLRTVMNAGPSQSAFVVKHGQLDIDNIGLLGHPSYLSTPSPRGVSVVGVDDLTSAVYAGMATLGKRVGVLRFLTGIHCEGGSSFYAHDVMVSGNINRGVTVSEGCRGMMGRAVVTGTGLDMGIGTFVGPGGYLRAADFRAWGNNADGIRLTAAAAAIWCDFCYLGGNRVVGMRLDGAVNVHLVGARFYKNLAGGITTDNGGYGRMTGALVAVNPSTGVSFTNGYMDMGQVTVTSNHDGVMIPSVTATGMILNRGRYEISDAGITYNTQNGLRTTLQASVSAQNCIVTGNLVGILEETSALVAPNTCVVTGNTRLDAAERNYDTWQNQIILGNTTADVSAGVRTYCVRRTGNAITTITLPPKPPAGFRVIVKDCKGNAAAYNMTVDAAGGETIDGAATAKITTNYGRWMGEFDGISEWSTLVLQ